MVRYKVPLRPRHIVSTEKGDFNPRKFLATVGEGRHVLSFVKNQTIFTQGDAADSIFYLQEGKVRLTVVSKAGKEATMGILDVGDFFGEGTLAGQPLRMETATAMTACTILRIVKKSMMLALHRENTLADLFLAYLLHGTSDTKADLVDQLFNSSEKRGGDDPHDAVTGQFFMNRFRQLGFVEYGENGIQVHGSLLNVILDD